MAEPSPAAPTCAKCAKPESNSEDPILKPCLSCKSVNYCSRDCKKADFKSHKKNCAELAQKHFENTEVKMASRAPPKAEGHDRGLRKWQFDT